MRTQIALAALVAFAAAQDEVSIEDAMAAAMEEALSQMTDEERAAWEAAQGALGDMGDMAVDMGDMAESGGDWEGEWDDKDMMDSWGEGAWSSEVEDAKKDMEAAWEAANRATDDLLAKEAALAEL